MYIIAYNVFKDASVDEVVWMGGEHVYGCGGGCVCVCVECVWGCVWGWVCVGVCGCVGVRVWEGCYVGVCSHACEVGRRREIVHLSPEHALICNLFLYDWSFLFLVFSNLLFHF